MAYDVTSTIRLRYTGSICPNFASTIQKRYTTTLRMFMLIRGVTPARITMASKVACTSPMTDTVTRKLLWIRKCINFSIIPFSFILLQSLYSFILFATTTSLPFFT